MGRRVSIRVPENNLDSLRVQRVTKSISDCLGVHCTKTAKEYLRMIKSTRSIYKSSKEYLRLPKSTKSI